MEQRHRLEKRQLNDEITRLKKSVTKGDKKKLKIIQADISRLESELQKRHEAEMAEVLNECDDLPVENMQQLNINQNGTSTEVVSKPEKKSRANKRREKKVENEKLHNQLLEDEEKQNKNSSRNREFSQITAKLDRLNMVLHEIPSDGDCLYNAIAHQLNQQAPSITDSISKMWYGQNLRKMAADQMQSFPDAYIPFLSSHNDPDLPMKIDEFGIYCDKVANTHEWGGQLEVRAISIAMEKTIRILQADGPDIIIGEEFGSPIINITYHRHAYGLGEHYNSSYPKDASEDKPVCDWTTVS